MEKWYDVYIKQIMKNGGNKEYMKLKISQKKKLLKIIRNNSGNGKFIEAGCGTGIMCSQLAYEGYSVTGVDIDRNILELASKLEKEYFGENKVEFEEKSIFNLNYEEKKFDLCYSVGVLEHFSDEEIVNSVRQQLNIAKKVIIVIPTKWFDDNEALHGDDRFLPLSYWRKLINKSNGNVLKEYSYPFKGKGVNLLIRIKKMFRPKAYRIFLIEKKDR